MNESPNTMLERAIEVALFCHVNQVDKNGEAYILHPLRVMLAVRERGGTIDQQTAAVLHDVIEDCGVTDEFLAARFPEAVCDLVDALTHQDGEDYPAFISRGLFCARREIDQGSRHRGQLRAPSFDPGRRYAGAPEG